MEASKPRRVAKAWEYKGVTVEPTYMSANGSGRECETLQGWEIEFRKPVFGNKCRWYASKRDAMVDVDRLERAIEVAVDATKGGRSLQEFEQWASLAEKAVELWPVHADVVEQAIDMIEQFKERKQSKEAADRLEEQRREAISLLSKLDALRGEERVEMMVKIISRFRA